MLAWLLVTPISAWTQPNCSGLQMPVASVGEPPEAYRAFCLQYEGDCDLDGTHTLEWSAAIQSDLERVNSDVNREIEFVSDWEFNGLVDVWDYPFACKGDCEDFALEKRRRLIEAGFPSASLTMAIAFHEVQFFPHAVLLVETDKGTFLLDNLYDAVLCWDAVPYIFTHRERPDGQWIRFMLP